MRYLSDSIRQDDADLQQLLVAIEQAQSLTSLFVAVWALIYRLSVHIIEYVLAQHAHSPTAWPPCPQCDQSLLGKGWVKREVTTLVNVIQWHRRVKRCPEDCAIGQVAPFDELLGSMPHQTE